MGMKPIACFILKRYLCGRGFAHNAIYASTLPPLILIVVPVMWRAKSEARNNTAPATSSAVAIRFKGIA